LSAKFVVTDTRLVIADHADNTAVCIALSVAAQTFARILGAQGYLSRTVEIFEGDDTKPPVFDAAILSHECARQGLSGFLDTVLHLAREFPGEIEVSDNRHLPVAVHRPPQPGSAEENATTESFAAMIPRPGGLRDTNGCQLRTEA
jgi:hypothetical protein